LLQHGAGGLLGDGIDVESGADADGLVSDSEGTLMDELGDALGGAADDEEAQRLLLVDLSLQARFVGSLLPLGLVPCSIGADDGEPHFCLQTLLPGLGLDDVVKEAQEAQGAERVFGAVVDWLVAFLSDGGLPSGLECSIEAGGIEFGLALAMEERSLVTGLLVGQSVAIGLALLIVGRAWRDGRLDARVHRLWVAVVQFHGAREPIEGVLASEERGESSGVEGIDEGNQA
jgi:hypothetical protein